MASQEKFIFLAGDFTVLHRDPAGPHKFYTASNTGFEPGNFCSNECTTSRKTKQIEHARTLQFEHYKNVAIRTQLTLAQKISWLN